MGTRRAVKSIGGLILLGVFLFNFGCGLKTRSVPQYEDGQYLGMQTETYFDGDEFAKEFFSMLVGAGVGVAVFNAMGGDVHSDDYFSSEWFVSGMAGEAAATVSYDLVDAAEQRPQVKESKVELK